MRLGASEAWDRLGRVFSLRAGSFWSASHASVPIAIHLVDGYYRVFYSTRNHEGRSYIGAFSLDLRDLGVSDIQSHPVLSPGRRGSFDEDGVMGSWIMRGYDGLMLFYVGWNRGISVPFRNALGVAILCESLDKAERVGDGPIMDRSLHDPFFVASCCVVPGGIREYFMWYTSCTQWDYHVPPGHRYHIKRATSSDLFTWTPNREVAIDYLDAREVAISRPSVLQVNGKWFMWFSTRGTAYQIGCATSADGSHWQRLDDSLGLTASKEGWDSQMVEYPFVFEHEDDIYMLYNGNGYGETGIGIARMTPAGRSLIGK